MNLEEKIKSALNEIRRFLQSDGGDISLVSVKGNGSKIRLIEYLYELF